MKFKLQDSLRLFTSDECMLMANLTLLIYTCVKISCNFCLSDQRMTNNVVASLLIKHSDEDEDIQHQPNW